MNPFERHGLTHLSASQCNTFAAEPCMWVLEKLMGHRSPSSAAMARGSAAEHGIETGLMDPARPVADCIDAALADYDRRTALSGDPNRQKERDGIPGLVETGLAELRQYGVPDAPEDGRQHKVEVTLEGVPVPFIGYQDFVYGAHGIVVDLKTQLRLSSSISRSHARQGALYVHGTNREMRFAYVTPKKCGVYVLENVAEHIKALQSIARSMERFLSVSDDAQELARLIAPNADSFYWNDPAAQAKRMEVWGY